MAVECREPKRERTGRLPGDAGRGDVTQTIHRLWTLVGGRGSISESFHSCCTSDQARLSRWVCALCSSASASICSRSLD